ncbi:MAG: EF-hand domain-containing protein [Desulfomonilia bacterium]
MVSGISSSNSYMNYMLFEALDTDGSGGISQSELDTWAKKMSSVTGTTIDTTNAVSTYGTDGVLSADELNSFMESTMQQGMGFAGIPPASQDSSDSSGSTDLFNAITGGSSQMTQAQLDTWATDMSKATGQTIDTTNAISTYDTNGDGTLSASEFQSFLNASGIQPPTSQDSSNSSASTDLFNAITGGSSQMTQAQLDTWASDMSQATGQTIDTTNAISTYDTNGDGTLSSSEFQSFLDANGISAPQNFGMAPPPPPPPSSGSSETSSSTTSSTSSADSIISKYDTNGDGVLSASELQAYLDDNSSTSSTTSSSLVEQALSAYLMNMGLSSSSMGLYMNSSLYGSAYSSVDYLA